MSRSRCWWHKCNHDRVLRDPYVSALPYEALGLLTHLQCLVGSTVRGHESGILHSEDGARITVDELLFLLSRGDEVQEAAIKRSLQLLVRARQVKCNKQDLEPDGHLRLMHWKADQGLAKSGDVERKRAAAERAREEEAAQVGAHLERFIKRLNRSVSEEELLTFIKARRGGRPQQRTCEAILEIWFEQGVLVRDADGLCALASLAVGSSAPPLGAGGVGPVGDGVVGEILPVGKIPVELELDPDKRVLPNSQLDPVGRAPAAHGGGETEEPTASEGNHQDYRDSQPPANAGQDKLNVGAGPESLADCMYEPGDAWRVNDPVHAAGRLLSGLPGWNDHHQPDRGRPKSEYVLLARWKDLRRDHGPKLAAELWRTILQGVISDKIEGHSWKTWTGIFLKRLKDLSEAEADRVAIAGGEQ